MGRRRHEAGIRTTGGDRPGSTVIDQEGVDLGGDPLQPAPELLGCGAVAVGGDDLERETDLTHSRRTQLGGVARVAVGMAGEQQLAVGPTDIGERGAGIDAEDPRCVLDGGCNHARHKPGRSRR